MELEALYCLCEKDPEQASKEAMVASVHQFHPALSRKCWEELDQQSSNRLASAWAELYPTLPPRHKAAFITLLYTAWGKGQTAFYRELPTRDEELNEFFYDYWLRESYHDEEKYPPVASKVDGVELYARFSEKALDAVSRLWFLRVLLEAPEKGRCDPESINGLMAQVRDNLTKAPERASLFRAFLSLQFMPPEERGFALAKSEYEWWQACLKCKRVSRRLLELPPEGSFQLKLHELYAKTRDWSCPDTMHTTSFDIPRIVDDRIILFKLIWYKKQGKIVCGFPLVVAKQNQYLGPRLIKRGYTSDLFFHHWVARPMFTEKGIELEQDEESLDFMAWIERYLPEGRYGVPCTLTIDPSWIKGLTKRLERLHEKPYIVTPGHHKLN